MTTFGPEWSRALCDGCQLLAGPPGIPLEWPLAVIALESGFNPMARSKAGARGLWQKMPVAGKEYDQADPVRQIKDAFGFWCAMQTAFKVGKLTTREAFYALNLAPARLKNGSYDNDTVLYAAPAIAYRMNAAPFGLDPNDPVGTLKIQDLASGLDAAVKRCEERFYAELEAAWDTEAA